MYRSLFIVLIVWIACGRASEDDSTIISRPGANNSENFEITLPKAMFLEEDSLYIESKNEILVAGYIQSAGLESIHGSSYDSFAAFQLISLKKEFFLITKKELKNHWGKCVIVKGHYPKGWDLNTGEYNKRYMFERTALIVDSILKSGIELCRQHEWYADFHLHDPDTIVEGFLKRNKRPAPDIAYDYRIALNKPIPLLYDNTITTKEIPIITNLSFADMEKVLEEGQITKFIGAIAYGYAETMVFHLTGIQFESESH